MATKEQNVTLTGNAPVSTSAVPSNDLANENGNSFLLFNSDWLKLQSYIAQSLKLPINTDQFQSLYGEFADEAEVEGCVAAMKAVAALSSQMGDPSILQKSIASNPSYVSGPTPPNEIYAHCIWLAGQISNTASSFQLTYSSLSQIFTGNQKADAATLRELLTGAGGLASQAQTMLGYTKDLQKKLSDFEASYTPVQNTILTYCGNESKILNDAQSAISTDQSQIDSLQKAADNAHKLWEDYTISATTTSVGVMILSCGLLWPVAVGLGAGLGAAAAHEMSVYNDLMGQIATENTDLQKKNRLVIDLNGFNGSLGNVQACLKNFANDLATIEGVWLTQNQQLTNIANLDDATLGQYSLVVQKIDLLNAQSQWQTIANNTSKFTTNCLVNYLTTVQFPTPIQN
jgi:hypothetical protein